MAFKIMIILFFIFALNCRGAENIENITVYYSASAVNPLIEAKLTISPNGNADLYIGTSWSIPGFMNNQAGYFSYSPSKAKLKELYRFLRKIKLEVQNFQPQPLPGVIRSLSFDNNGVKTHVSPYDTTYDKALFKADLILQEIIREASLFPKSNIKTSIQIKRLNNRIIPTLLLENNGTIPIKLSINDMENKQLININMEILKKSASGFNFEKIKSIKFSPKEIQLFIKKNGFIKNQIILDKNNKILIPLPEQDALTLTDDMFFRCNLHLWLITDNYKPIHIQTDYPISEKTEKDLLKLTVKLNHVSYQRETPISLTLCLTNISDRPLLVPNRFLLNYNHSPKPYRDIYFIFEGPTGYKSNIVFLLNAGEIKKENLMILLPGKKIENVINLTKYFSLHLPGKYIITAHYTNFTNISGTNVWCGEVISDKFIITRR